MVQLHAREVAGRWFGAALAGDGLVATAVASTRARVLEELRRSLPAGTAHRIPDDELSEPLLKTIDMLAELEAGREPRKEFSLSAEHFAGPLARVLRVASAIPLGFVTSYGDVGKTADAEAREVGRAMASNPLYPIVPCHRVVGADLSLVGYAGSRGKDALRAKLDRLAKEARGFETERDMPVEGGALRVYPVEWAIVRATRRSPRPPGQRTLFE
jgi:O-6-methylguanine DNA methyltransferase